MRDTHFKQHEQPAKRTTAGQARKQAVRPTPDNANSIVPFGIMASFADHSLF